MILASPPSPSSLPVTGAFSSGMSCGKSATGSSETWNSQPTTPADFTATIYHCLGLDPRTETHDQGGRPLPYRGGFDHFAGR